MFLTRRSLLSIDDIGQGYRHLSFSFSNLFLQNYPSISHNVTSVSFLLILSEYVLIVRGIQYHEKGEKNWLVLFFLLSSNRFHQPLVYKCLCLCAPPWVCPLFLVYLNLYCYSFSFKSVIFATFQIGSLSLSRSPFFLYLSIPILPFACILTKGGSYLSISYFL